MVSIFSTISWAIRDAWQRADCSRNGRQDELRVMLEVRFELGRGERLMMVVGILGDGYKMAIFQQVLDPRQDYRKCSGHQRSS
jgi:hypothetical protein